MKSAIRKKIEQGRMRPRPEIQPSDPPAPKPSLPASGPRLVAPPHWTERLKYRQALEELERMCAVEARREAQLIQEAEHAAELRHLRRKAMLLERVKGATL